MRRPVTLPPGSNRAVAREAAALHLNILIALFAQSFLGADLGQFYIIRRYRFLDRILSLSHSRSKHRAGARMIKLIMYPEVSGGLEPGCAPRPFNQSLRIGSGKTF